MLEQDSGFIGDDLAWQADALCAEPRYRADDWFENGRKATDRAKRTCMACLVQRECLSYAIAGEITEGVWGALTGPERARLIDAGITAEAVLAYGPHAFAGLRAEHERELDARVERIRFGGIV